MPEEIWKAINTDDMLEVEVDLYRLDEPGKYSLEFEKGLFSGYPGILLTREDLMRLYLVIQQELGEFGEINEIDRAARAYGFEIGRGKPITTIVETSEDNPFMKKDWQQDALGLDMKTGEIILGEN